MNMKLFIGTLKITKIKLNKYYGHSNMPNCCIRCDKIKLIIISFVFHAKNKIKPMTNQFQYEIRNLLLYKESNSIGKNTIVLEEVNNFH